MIVKLHDYGNHIRQIKEAVALRFTCDQSFSARFSQINSQRRHLRLEEAEASVCHYECNPTVEPRPILDPSRSCMRTKASMIVGALNCVSDRIWSTLVASMSASTAGGKYIPTVTCVSTWESYTNCPRHHGRRYERTTDRSFIPAWRQWRD